MILFYISIPIMVLGLAVATVPLLAAMRFESRAERPDAPVHASGARTNDITGARPEMAPTDEVPVAA